MTIYLLGPLSVWFCYPAMFWRAKMIRAGGLRGVVGSGAKPREPNTFSTENNSNERRKRVDLRTPGALLTRGPL